MKQAMTIHNGVELRRWYLYETDGHRRVVWAEDESAALRKGWRGTHAMLSDHVEPAPALGEDAKSYKRVHRPAGDPFAHR